jgi:hypothetical protein
MAGHIWMPVLNGPQVDEPISPTSIQTRASLLTGYWVHARQKLPVDGTNTWDSVLPDNGFFRLSVTNMP